MLVERSGRDTIVEASASALGDHIPVIIPVLERLALPVFTC